jgi:dTDP-4-dehydrorhamnose reductase
MSVYDRILITGGGGMLAQALLRALRLRGLEAIALDRSALDIAQKAALVTKKVIEQQPTLILNCAGFTKVDACETERMQANKVNGFGPGYLADVTRTIGAKLVHYSTDFVFDGTKREPYLTTDEPNPQSAYGGSKSLGERMAAADPNTLIIRTAWLYGPGGANFVRTMLNAAKAGKALKVVNDQVGSPTFTYDLADATLDLIDAGSRGVFHVTNSGQTSWFDFAKAIFEEFEMKPDLSATTSAQWKQLMPQSAARPAYSVLDLSEYQRVTGKTPPQWRDALHRYRLVAD